MSALTSDPWEWMCLHRYHGQDDRFRLPSSLSWSSTAGNSETNRWPVILVALDHQSVPWCAEISQILAARPLTASQFWGALLYEWDRNRHVAHPWPPSPGLAPKRNTLLWARLLLGNCRNRFVYQQILRCLLMLITVFISIKLLIQKPPGVRDQ